MRQIVVVLLGGLLAACADGSPSPLAPSGRYVALGASFAAGPFVPEVIAESGLCVRSTNNYPRQIAAAFALDLVDVSCSGARIEHLVSASQNGNPPQLDALTPETRLVTVTVGGNDVGYIGGLTECTNAGREGRSCLGTTVDPAAAAAALAGLRDELLALFHEIRKRAPGARTVFVPYPRVVGDAGPCPPDIPLVTDDAIFFRALAENLDRISAEAARDAGVELVDVYGPSAGHDACAAPAERWIEGLHPASPAAPFHPNAAGMRAVADLVVAALRHPAGEASATAP